MTNTTIALRRQIGQPAKAAAKRLRRLLAHAPEHLEQPQTNG